MKSEFYSKGKLLLTAEYVVLDGAKALALPTKKGQSLHAEKNDSGILNWSSFNCHDQIWYKTQLKTSLLFKSSPPIGNSTYDETLFKILWEALQMNPNFLNKNSGYQISTYLEFDRLWGLGTSSTLINNIANWAKVNPFKLLNISFGGSGYDIAAAEATTPIFYTRTSFENPTIVKAPTFNPSFKERLFFIYLEEKKNSKEAIKNYRSKPKKTLNQTISKINKLTEQIAICDDFVEFENLLNEHERIIASILNCSTIKEERFKDFTGSIKSLGAWGGDFILATGTLSEMNYFLTKGLSTIISYNDMVF